MTALPIPGRDGARLAVERETIEFFVLAAGALDLPRSVGEIYGALFCALEPMTSEALIRRLRLSKGAMSQGLRKLRAFGAVRRVYVPGDRRDHFVAETELRRLASGFLREQVRPQLDQGAERIERLQELAAALPPDVPDELARRVARLAQWRRRAERLLPLLNRIVEGRLG